jgi:hypothetical protein
LDQAAKKALAKFILSTLFFLLLVSRSAAQNSSATWTLTTANNNLATTGSLSASTMTRGAGVTAVGFNANGYTSRAWGEASLEAARLANDYLQFALTPANGYTLSVSAIQFIASVSQVAATNGARLQVQYATTADFAAPVNVGGNATLTTTATTVANTGLDIPVAAGGTLYVRIYTWGLSSATTDFTFKDVKILANACPAVTISYPSPGAYCRYAGTTVGPTRTGLSGGSYTSSAGLALNSSTGVVDVAASTAGVYTVTYTVNGGTGCTNIQATTTITINDLPIAFKLTGPDGAEGAFCTNGTPATFTLSGSQEGVTYTFNAINPGGNLPPGQNFTVEGVGGTLEFVQTPDGKWSYKVTGKDDATGCSNTMEGLLTAVDGPRVTSHPGASLAVCAGSTATLTANFTAANSLIWQVSTDGGANWSTVPNSSPYTITKTASNSSTTLAISNVGTAFNGAIYRVMYGGPAACPINYSNGTMLTVSVPVSITAQPVSKTLCHNSNLVLSVGATNATGYQWYKNGTAIAGATGAQYTKTYDAATDAGSYSVLVKGNAPCADKASQNITVATTTSTTTTWQGPSAGSNPLMGTAWELASNWSCGVPTRTTDAIIPADVIDGYPTIRAAVSGEVRNLTINGGGFGAFLTVSGKLQIFGNVINNGGVFDATAGTVEFIGSSAQTIPAGLFTGNTVQNLVISNNVTLAGALNLTGALTFGAVNNKTFATSDYLTLKSSQATTARVGDLTNNHSNSGNAITGNVTVERYIPAHNSRRWRLLTAPVTGTSIQQAWQEGRTWNGSGAEQGEFGTLITGQQQVSVTTANSNGFDFWSAIAGGSASVRRYIPSSGLSSNMGANWAALETTTTAGFGGHEAYLLFVRGDRTVSAGSLPGSTNLRAKGPLKQNTAYSFTVPATQSHTLVGNPYASPIDFSKLYAANSTRIQPWFWIWRASLGTTGGYVMVQPNGTGGYEAVPGDGTTIAVEPIIGSGEGFFVVPAAGATTTTSITLLEAHKSSGKPAISVFRQTGIEPAKLRVNLFKPFEGEKTLLDGVLAQFSKEAGTDNRAKAVNIDENLSIKKGGQDLIVTSGAEPKEGDSLQLRLWNTVPGEYTLELAATAFAQDVPVAVLYDRFAKKESILPLTGNGLPYTFSVNGEGASQDPQRFVIYFRAARVETVKPASLVELEKSATLYPNPVSGTATNLQFSAKPAGRYHLTLFAPTGQVVAKQVMEHAGGTATYPVPVQALASGTYLLELSGPGGKSERLQMVVGR